MATNPSTLPENSGRITAPNASYPYGSAKDDTTGATGDGTPLRSAWANDIFGFFQWLLTRAGVTPSGNSETATASDLSAALDALYGRGPALRVYTVGGTWTRPAGCRSVLIEAVGGGGGGGGGNTGVNTSSYGASGAAGGYARKLVTNPPASLAIAIGSAGSAGSAGSGQGGNGGNTTVTGTGVAITANGGAGGGVPVTAPPAGGTATGGYINIPGGDGGRLWAGMGTDNGGPSFFGGGGGSTPIDSAGPARPGQAYGSGGGGGGANSTVNKAGGAGKAGVIIITEFYA